MLLYSTTPNCIHETRVSSPGTNTHPLDAGPSWPNSRQKTARLHSTLPTAYLLVQFLGSFLQLLLACRLADILGLDGTLQYCVSLLQEQIMIAGSTYWVRPMCSGDGCFIVDRMVRCIRIAGLFGDLVGDCVPICQHALFPASYRMQLV